MGQIDPTHIQAARRVSIVDVVSRVVALKKEGREYKGLCPFHSEKTPSFTVVEQKGFFHCFGCGAHGDVIDFLCQSEGLTFAGAVKQLSGTVRRSGPGQQESREGRRRGEAAEAELLRKEEHRRAGERRKAWAIWQKGRPITAGSAVDAYLRQARCLLPETYRYCSALRAHDGLEYWVGRGKGRFACLGKWPAMLAAFQGPQGKFEAVHMTWLTPDGGDKLRLFDDEGVPLPAKKVRGSPQGAAMWLAPVGMRHGKKSLAGAEGIETALSVIQASGWPCWALYSLGNFAGRGKGRGAKHPRKKGVHLPSPVPDMEGGGWQPPDGLDVFVWCRDGDDGDAHAASALVERGVQRLVRQGVAVHVADPPDGMDFNDLLRARAATGGGAA